MGASTARQGDVSVGVCPAHKSPKNYNATFTGVSVDVIAEGAGCANLASIGVASCGHPIVVVSASSTVLVNGAGDARIGDAVTNPGPGNIVSGASTVTSG